MLQNQKAGENVRAVGRALQVLLAFGPQDTELSVTELLRRVPLTRPTLYRLLYSLQEHGFVTAFGQPQRFRLGPSVGRLAQAWSGSLDLTEIARPHLERLLLETRETVSLSVPVGGERQCLMELPSPQVLSYKRGVGYTEPLARGAVGRALLAWRGLMDSALQAFVPGSGLDLDGLTRALADTRHRGYAVSRGEVIPGAIALSAPVFDRHQWVAGTLTIVAPEVRVPDDRLVHMGELLCAECVKLSAAIGHRASHP